MKMVANDCESSFGEPREQTEVVMQGSEVHTKTLNKMVQNIQDLTLSVKAVTQDIEVNLASHQ